jgi:predicted NBD/HSP70 family sugar kinase
MEHIGIDLGSRESQVCVRNSAGEIIEEARRPTRELASWLATRAPARVILETCNGSVSPGRSCATARP